MSNPYPYTSYGNSQMNNFVMDTTVLSPTGQPTLKTVGVPSESNGNWTAAKPGDHVVFTAWIKTGASTQAGGAQYGDGARIGIDFYSDVGRIGQYCADGTPAWDSVGNNASFDATRAWVVPFGSDWTKRTMDFIMPNFVTSDGVSIAGYTAGQQVESTGFIPWMAQVSFGWLDQATVWFGDVSVEVSGLDTSGLITITSLVNPVGAGKIDAYATSQSKGCAMTLNAYANSPYIFQRWVFTRSSDNLSTSWGSTNPLTFIFNENGVLEADFQQIVVTPPPTPKATLAARFPVVGNRALVQVYLRRIRDKFISKKLHSKLHPLV
jgi:hypothetical protein